MSVYISVFMFKVIFIFINSDRSVLRIRRICLTAVTAHELEGSGYVQGSSFYQGVLSYERGCNGW